MKTQPHSRFVLSTQFPATLTTILWLCMLLLLPLAVRAQAVGETAPDFSGVTLAGDDIVLSELQGTVVLLDFWASWCGPCREELPFLADLYKAEHDKGFEILAINVDDQAGAMDGFIKSLDFELPFPVIANPGGELPTLYDIAAMPTAVFIDRKGTVRFVHSGFRTSHEERYRNELELLLEESN